MRAVDALMECLKAEGVDVVFGLPGGANLPTYDAFYDAGIRHILVRHEAGGGHAAEGYAKATGKVWVNLNTGVYHRGGRWYGKTKQGKFMTEAEAKAAGFKAAAKE